MSQLPRRAPSAIIRAICLALAATAALASSVTFLASVPASAGPGAHVFDEPIFSANARGDITTIGNVTTTCNPGYTNELWSAAESAAACGGATSGAGDLRRYDGATMPPINNRLDMEFVDVDGDGATFASSTARLEMPAGADVLWAGLHWNAATDVPSAERLYGSTYEQAPRATAERFKIRLRTPATTGYTTLDASTADGVTTDTWDDTNPGGTVSYGGFVDITNLVEAGGPGAYTAADVQSCTGFGGCFGSWSISVAYAHRSLPPRNLNVWHGWQLTTPTVAGGTQTFTVNGITPPPNGPVSARIGVVQADGDRGLGPDSLEISSPNRPAWTPFTTIDRPLRADEDDWFNSTVNAFGRRRPNSAANPNFLANLNHDIALVENRSTITNADTGFSFRVRTAGTESLYSQVVHSAVAIYAPQIAIDKSVAPVGPVKSGDEVTWTLKVRNAGIDPIRNTTITDPLPSGLDYVPGSVRYSDGGPSSLVGVKTDRAGDDQVDWDPLARALTMRAGAGANAVQGGTSGVDPAADGSHQMTVTYRTRVTAPPDRTIRNEAIASGTGRELDDSFGPLRTIASDDAAITTAAQTDLGITKTDSEAEVSAVGDRYTYTLVAINAGPSPATGVAITDELDPRLEFVSSTDPCTGAGRRISCTVGGLASGATRSMSFVVEVLDLGDPTTPIPNTATITGNQPNPDCVAPTLQSLCNADDESTPIRVIDLGITKTDDDHVINRIGEQYSYLLTITNAGPDGATGVMVTDELDRRLAFVSAKDCHNEGQTVTCLVGELAAGASTNFQVVVKVLEVPSAKNPIPNLASTSAAEPDPDCVTPTPNAACNTDTEETPAAPTQPPSPPAKPDPPARANPGPRRSIALTGWSAMPLAALGAGGLVAGLYLLSTSERIKARRGR